MNHPLNLVWETYVASWKAPSAPEKHALFEQCLDPQCVYSDPQALTHGWAELTAYMAAFHEQVPGGHFVTKSFSSHHQQSLATWDMLDSRGQIIGEGASFGKYNDQNKLVCMTGFFKTA